jgi:hypothetical protein
MEQGSWVTGFLVTDAWAIGGKSGRDHANSGLLQPWLYYNFPSGTYVFSEPVITADWKADSNERGTVPVGIGVGRIFQIGSQLVNLQVAAFCNVEKPSGSADWTIRPQDQFLFPK